MGRWCGSGFYPCHQFCMSWCNFWPAGTNFALFGTALGTILPPTSAPVGRPPKSSKTKPESWLPPQVPKSAKLVPDWVGSDWIPICFPQEYMSCTLPGTIPKHSRPVLSPIRATQFILARIKGMISSPAFVFMMFLAMFAGPNASIRVHLMDSPLGF